jgi:hypothetical protein
VRRRHIAVVIAIVLTLGAGAFYVYGRSLWYPLLLRITGPRTVADVVAKYGPAARARLLPHFRKAGVTYPPKSVALLVFKQERRVSLWADGRFIRAYPILAASGHAGPKLREGDYQVPEGLYRIAYLNPSSSYHLSMKVSYPNAFDLQMAKRDGRTQLGGDIFMHGKNLSIGCVAVGDPAIEELFTLVAQSGLARVRVLIAPNDLRARGAIVHPAAPLWVGELYATLRKSLAAYPLEQESDASFDVRGMPKVVPIFK